MAGEEEKSNRGAGAGGRRVKKPGEVGMRVQAFGKDGPQLHRTWGKRITAHSEDVFLGALRASCNVRYSADQSGFSANALYARRARDPGFAERWREARDEGFARVEALLVETAARMLSGKAPCGGAGGPVGPIPTMTVSEAITVVKLHRGAVSGEGRGMGHGRSRPQPLDKHRDSILRKLSALERARRREEAERAAAQAGAQAGGEAGAQAGAEDKAEDGVKAGGVGSQGAMNPEQPGGGGSGPSLDGDGDANRDSNGAGAGAGDGDGAGEA